MQGHLDERLHEEVAAIVQAGALEAFPEPGSLDIKRASESEDGTFRQPFEQ